MILRNEFCACEQFLVETEGDSFTFDLVVLADRRMLCMNRGVNFREFQLPNALEFEDMDENTIVARCDGLNVVASRRFHSPRVSPLGERVFTHLMRQSNIMVLTEFFDEQALASAKSPAFYIRLREDGDYDLLLVDGTDLVASAVVWDDVLELAEISFR